MTSAGPTGPYPKSLVVGSDGILYGIAVSGGNLRVLGAAFKIDPSTAAFTVLRLFGTVPHDPSVPSFLAQGSDGNLYGTSLNGGATGTMAPSFCSTTSGNVTTLHSFENSVDGFGPGTIMQASTGDLYGTMRDYASNGEVFRLELGWDAVEHAHLFGRPGRRRSRSPR